MSELTKVFEKLEAWRASPKLGQIGQVDEIHGWRNPVELREHEVDELLALRTLRDAGDEEVERLTNEIQYQLRTEDIIRLRDIAITRGQQLREIRESCPCNCHNQPSSKEAMGLDEHSNCGECIKGLLEEAEAMQDSLCEKYESELREAREEIERLSGKLEETQETAISFSQQIANLTAIKSCPAMAEVDALGNSLLDVIQTISDRYGIGVAGFNATRRAKDVIDLARRSISSRQEVVGLLRNLWHNAIVRESICNEMGSYGWFPRILEIVEGK